VNGNDNVLANRRIQGDATRQLLAENERLSRDLAVHGKQFPMVKVRVKVPFNLGFGRVGIVDEIVEVKADDAAWLTAPSIAWAEKL